MIIDAIRDAEFVDLIGFLFEFDFPNKNIISEQIQKAVIKKEKSEYHIAFQFYVDATSERLPADFDGIPVLIQVRNGESLTLCELYICNQYIAEYRLYNIDTSKLDTTCLRSGEALFIREDL